MKSRLIGAVAASVFMVFASSSTWATVWDLADNWSDASNPNGVWTYREGLNALPARISMRVAGINQTAWEVSNSIGTLLPFWAQSQSNNPDLSDILTGGVFLHSTDATNGMNHGVGDLIRLDIEQTSPAVGVNLAVSEASDVPIPPALLLMLSGLLEFLLWRALNAEVWHSVICKAQNQLESPRRLSENRLIYCDQA